MAKVRKNRKSPSRQRYEKEHRTRSFRLDKETNEYLDEHLKNTGCSVADFVKGCLGKEKSMVKKRVKILASRQVDPSVEDRLRCLEDLVFGIYCLTVDTDNWPPLCPRCENQKLFRCEGREIESNLADPTVPTWKCPKCGFFLNTYKRIDPKSIRWVDPYSGDYIDKPRGLS